MRSGAARPSGQNRVLILLLVSVWINYIDRGNLSVAAPILAPELGLTPTRLGVLFSAFFWTYAGFQAVAGWMVDRYDVYRVYAAGFLVWSAATLLTGVSSGFAALLALRMLLGLGESVAYPAYSRILTTEFPEHKRGMANALVDVGTKAGPAVGTLAGGLLVAGFGWRFLFLSIGLASLVWLIPWMRSIPAAAEGRARRIRGPGIREILRRRQAWVTFVGLFGFNYAFYFLLSWLPSYLVMERKFSLQAMSVYGALPYGATAVASLVTGYLTDRHIARSGPASVRKHVAIAGLVLCATTLPAVAIVPTVPAMALLVISFVGIGMYTANAWAITQTLAGPLAAGQWTGVQNAIGNLGGVVAPVVTGWLVSGTGSFYGAFLAAAMNLAMAAMLYLFALGPVVPVRWQAGQDG